MRLQSCATVLLDAATEEVHPHAYLLSSRSEIERKDLASDGFLGETMVGMDPAQAVFLEEDAGTVVTTLQVGTTSEVNDHLFTKNRFPLLGLEFLEILFPQLHGEIPATESASVTAVLLPVHARHQDR